MPYHVYDPATGEIVAISAGSHEQVEKWEAEGFIVTTGPRVDRKAYHYVDGELVAKPTPTPEEALALAKARQYAQASGDYERYVASLGYTAAWQRTAQAQRLALQRVLADPSAGEEQKAAAQAAEERFAALEEFLVVELGLYFAKVGRAIFAAASLDELAQVSWDFSQFDSQDPKVTMHADVFPRLAVAKGKA